MLQLAVEVLQGYLQLLLEDLLPEVSLHFLRPVPGHLDPLERAIRHVLPVERMIGFLV